MNLAKKVAEEIIQSIELNRKYYDDKFGNVTSYPLDSIIRELKDADTFEQIYKIFRTNYRKILWQEFFTGSPTFQQISDQIDWPPNLPDQTPELMLPRLQAYSDQYKLVDDEDYDITQI